MKVTVTGASGHLGRHVCKILSEQGHELCGVDSVYWSKMPGRMLIADLSRRELCYAAVEGADAVVHLANLSNQNRGDAQTVFNLNVTANMNIFQAAYECGVRKLVYASSIQTALDDRHNPFNKPPQPVSHLPVDHTLPARAMNPYALSKVVGELQMEYFCRMADLSGVAIRYPWLYSNEQFRIRKHWGEKNQLFSLLHFADAATLVAAILRAKLPGFRIYFPSSDHLLRMKGTPAEIAAQHFPDVPRHREPLQCFVDIGRITEETGWHPIESIDEMEPADTN